MGYTNGLGSLQQHVSTADVGATGKTAGTVKTDQASLNAAQNGAGASVNGAGSGSDQTTLSSFSGLMAQALTGSDVRGDKVAGLQQQIAAGTYNVSASDVAGKLIDVLLR